MHLIRFARELISRKLGRELVEDGEALALVDREEKKNTHTAAARRPRGKEKTMGCHWVRYSTAFPSACDGDKSLKKPI